MNFGCRAAVVCIVVGRVDCGFVGCCDSFVGPNLKGLVKSFFIVVTSLVDGYRKSADVVTCRGQGNEQVTLGVSFQAMTSVQSSDSSAVG